MLSKFAFNPGIVKDDPPLTAEGFWIDGNNVRFYRGRPEKIKGWQKMVDEPVIGKARAAIPFTNFDGKPFLVVGTHSKLDVVDDDSVYNVTPLESEHTAVSVALTTTSGSATVAIEWPTHGLSVGQGLYFSNASGAVGGVTLSGQYTVLTIINASNFTVTNTTPATSSTTGGITVDIDVEIEPGNPYGIVSFGWGAGGYDVSTWGTPRTGSILLFPRNWSLAPFGNYVLAVPFADRLYVWQGNSSVRAVVEPTSPDRIDFMFVTPERFVVALGTHNYDPLGPGDYNPMLVRWADQETYSVWDPSATNTAGEFTLASGTKILGGVASKLQNLIWTDTSLYAMRYLGDTQYIFGFDLIGTNCGLIGPQAFAEKDGRAFWMSPGGQFFAYDGGAPRVIDCSVRKYVFEDINQNQFRTIECGISSEYNEVYWWYASANSNEIDRWVAYNYREQCWTLGDFPRTSWVDKSVFDYPIGIDPDGNVYYHDVGYDADGTAMTAFIQSAPFDLGDGDQILNITRVVPDVILEGNLDITLYMRRWQNAPVEQTKSLVFTENTQHADTRAQGRLAQIQFGSNGLGEWWRLGDIRMDIKQGGKR